MSAAEVDLPKRAGEPPSLAALDLTHREQVARRAYEISLSPWGRSCEENWAQAEAELGAQRAAWPEPR